MIRRYSTLMSLSCLALILSLSGCAAAVTGVGLGLEAYGDLKQGVAAYCKLPPEGRAALRAKVGMKQIIKCEGDPPVDDTGSAAMNGLRGTLY